MRPTSPAVLAPMLEIGTKGQGEDASALSDQIAEGRAVARPSHPCLCDDPYFTTNELARNSSANYDRYWARRVAASPRAADRSNEN